MVEARIVTAPDVDSPTVMFENADTPSRAYSILTDAVIGAKFHDDFVELNTEAIPPHTTIGTAVYDEDAEEVTELTLDENILAEYGVLE